MSVDAMERRPPDLEAPDPEPHWERIGRPAAVRPLALCCAVLLALGVAGVGILQPARSTSVPVNTSDTGAGAGATQVTPSGGPLSTGTVTVAPSITVASTTTTVQPAVTFPTVPHR